MKYLTVNTHLGPVKGLVKSSILGRDFASFTNIPYMKGPVGRLRFRDPEEPDVWVKELDGTRQAENYRSFNPVTLEKTGREDASFINVYSPVLELGGKLEKLPVIVWVMASGHEMLGPDYFLQKDVVVVTFNHRFGPIGYLSLKDPELGIPGNAGLKDQIMALKWIQKNIENFGGDPKNVTICGESHGSYSINYLMISDLAKGLFHKAIMQSGTAFNKWCAQTPPRNWTERLARQFGYDGDVNERKMLEFLESVDPVDLINSTLANLSDVEKFGEQIMSGYGPVIEPYITEKTFIHEDPVLMARKAWSKDVDIIIGANSLEGCAYLYMATENTFNILTEESYFAPLREIGLALGDEKAEEFGKRIKEIYYGKSEANASNPEPYLKYMTDSYFWHPIHRWIMSRLTYGSGKSFLYRFDAVTDLNFMKHLFSKTSNFSGAAHGDEIAYLWKFDADSFKELKPISIESNEFKTIKRMINCWTSFAKNGIPDCDSDVVWEHLASRTLPFNCMNITAQEWTYIPFPENDRMVVWNSVFKDAKVDMF